MKTPRTTVAVVGGGLAGLAAAIGAARAGLRVELFEQRRRLGGRAGSFCEPHTRHWIDYCQHVALGCCTNLADFCRLAGVRDCFRTDRRLHFIGPEGTRHDFAPAGWLPAPLHLLPALMRFSYLSWRERLAILRTLRRLAREPAARAAHEETAGAWLRRQGESPRAIERFWSVVLLGALSETVDRAALGAARKVFVDGFLASRRACELVLPRLPLAEIFDQRVAARLADLGVVVHRGIRVKRIEGDRRRAEAVIFADGTRRPFDSVVVAVPWRQVRGLLAPQIQEAMPTLARIGQFQPGAITALHLWFDRAVTRLPHAALVGRLSQWVFADPQAVSRRMGRSPTTVPGPICVSGGTPSHPTALRGLQPGHYCQVVISASHTLGHRSRDELLAEVCGDLAAVWPDARHARLLHQRIVTHHAAVFALQPGNDELRPSQRTPIENLALAGDWTATGWPATMEGAVRSGYLAAEAILGSLGRDVRLLVPDLPRGRLAQWLLA